MGNERQLREEGGFTENLYHQIGETIIASNGVEGKIMERIEGNAHDSLPKFSNTSEVYFKVSDETGEIEQARVFDGRIPKIDIDWDHSHKGSEKGKAHVHEWYKGNDGKWKRGKTIRDMTSAEIARYGELLKLACPDIKF